MVFLLLSYQVMRFSTRFYCTSHAKAQTLSDIRDIALIHTDLRDIALLHTSLREIALVHTSLREIALVHISICTARLHKEI
jgi:hypothetical protein